MSQTTHDESKSESRSSEAQQESQTKGISYLPENVNKEAPYFEHFPKYVEKVIHDLVLCNINRKRYKNFFAKTHKFITTNESTQNITKILPLLAAHYGGFLLSEAISRQMIMHDIKDSKEYLPPEGSGLITGFQVVGSTIEGVGTITSDIDAMFVINPIKYVSQVFGHEIKNVNDLQYFRREGYPLYMKVKFRLDQENSVLISSNEFKQSLNRLLRTKHPSFVSQGPSDIGTLGQLEFDKVYCLPLPLSVTKPLFNEWKERIRKKTFFHPYHIDAIIQSKCYLVPVGPTLSDNTSWRISFSLAESLFMNFLSNIHKTVLLIVKRNLKEKVSIPSYYIKTVFMRMCEDVAVIQWKQENIFSLSIELKRRVILALSKKEIQHYFLSGCNILATKPRSVIHTYLQGVTKSNKTLCVENMLHEDSSHLSVENWRQNKLECTVIPFKINLVTEPKVSLALNNNTKFREYFRMLENVIMNWCFQTLVLLDKFLEAVSIAIPLEMIAETFASQLCHIEKSLLPITQTASWQPLLAIAFSKVFLANVFSSLEYANTINSSNPSYGPITIGRVLFVKRVLSFLLHRKQFDKLCDTSQTGKELYFCKAFAVLQLTAVYALHLMEIVSQKFDDSALRHPLLAKFLVNALYDTRKHESVRNEYADVIFEIESGMDEDENFEATQEDSQYQIDLENALAQAKIISATHILWQSKTDKDEQSAWELLQDPKLSQPDSKVTFEIWQKEFFKHFSEIYNCFPFVVSSDMTVKLSSHWIVQCLLEKVKPSNRIYKKDSGKHITLEFLVNTVIISRLGVYLEDKLTMQSYLRAYHLKKMPLHRFLTSCIYFKASKFVKFIDEITSVRTTFKFLSTIIRILEGSKLLLPYFKKDMKETFPWLSITKPFVVRTEGEGDSEICYVDCRQLFHFVLFRAKSESQVDFEFAEIVGLEDLQY